MATYGNYRSAGAAGADGAPASTDVPAGGGRSDDKKAYRLAWALAIVVMALTLVTIFVSVAGSGVASVTVTTAGLEQGADDTAQAQVTAEDVAALPVVSVYAGDVTGQLAAGDFGEEVPLFTKQIELNQQVTLDALTARGTYTILVTDAPVLNDGTTFIIPDPQVIELQGGNVNAQFLLLEDLG